MGVGPDYREFIMLPREHSARYDGALTQADIIKRMRALHAVRGHLRHYQDGKVVFVKPHLRGKGDAVQVKDYVTRP